MSPVEDAAAASVSVWKSPGAVYGNDVCFRLSKARAESENQQQPDEPFSHDGILLMAIENDWLLTE